MTGSASSEEDMEMDAYDDDIKVVSEARKAYEVDYKPLTHQDVEDLMVADIEYIRTIFGVDVSILKPAQSSHFQ
jgi:ariadne-1